MSERWAAAETYEPYVGRWSRLVAREFVNWLRPADGLSWLDVGCGTGALGHTILTSAAPQLLVGVDRSLGFITAARAAAGTPVHFAVADAQSLPIASGEFDIAVSGLVLNFVPKQDRMITEMARTVRPNGKIAMYVWDYAERMQLIRSFWDAAVELQPSAKALDEGWRFPICNPEALQRLLEEQGLEDVEVRAIEVPTVFRDFDDYWSPFLGGQGPAPGYATSLSETDRARLRELLRSRLPAGADGSIALVARAWAVRGRRGGS